MEGVGVEVLKIICVRKFAGKKFIYGIMKMESKIDPNADSFYENLEF